MSRKTARETAFKLIFEQCVTKEQNTITYDSFCQNLSEDDKKYLDKVYFGFYDKSEFIKNLITKYSIDFSYDRIFKIDLAILSLAIYELFFYEDIPMEVIVNEAVELSKIYSTDKSIYFINGVLSSIIKEKEQILSECENN